MFVEMSLDLYTPRGTTPIDLVRMTAVLRKVGKHMLFTHFHFSVPDPTTLEGELIPGGSEPKVYDEVTILFTDFVEFTTMVSTIPAKKLVQELNEIFAEFDRIMELSRLKKIKTIGDSYMAVAGLDNEFNNHALNAINAAREILVFLDERNSNSPFKWNTRIGIHSGSVVGGVIGRDKLTFDIWGDTVNLASAVEQASEVNRINISAYTFGLIQDEIPCEYRGKINIKDKRMIDMYFVNR